MTLKKIEMVTWESENMIQWNDLNSMFLYLLFIYIYRFTLIWSEQLL